MPDLWVVAGGNGAGKTTFVERYLKPKGIIFVNADELAKRFFPDDPEANSYRAAKLAAQARQYLIEEGKSFCFETVFSHSSKIDFVAHAKSLGYTIRLIFIHLETDRLNRLRVLNRVDYGGHSVPENKIVERIPRVLDCIQKALPLFDSVDAFDNASVQQPFLRVFSLRAGQLQYVSSPLPSWAEKLLNTR